MFRLVGAAWRALKHYLWSRIADKAERYARCRQCSMLLRISDETGHDDVYVLEQHLGHILDEVTYVSLTEWARIRVSA